MKKGDTATLQCDVNGDKPINVVWLRGGKQELNPSTNYKIHTKQDVTPEGVAAELQIVNVDSADGGAYFCQVGGASILLLWRHAGVMWFFNDRQAICTEETSS